jgi:hypothetical protein
MTAILPGLLYLAGLAAFAFIVFWAVSNDAPRNAGASRGLLAMLGTDEMARRDQRDGRTPSRFRRTREDSKK